MHNKQIIKTFGNGIVSGSPDAGTAGVLDTANDVLLCDVRELEGITIYVNQLVDAGTATILVQASVDGVNWATVTNGTLSEASFAAGANTAVIIGFSDARGMYLQAQQIRCLLSAVSGGGSYSFAVAGLLLKENR